MRTETAKQGWWSTRLTILGVLVTACVWGAGFPEDQAFASMRISPSGDAIEFTYEADDSTYSFTIPIHRSGDTRYFSAGVGVEERRVEYPSFPLKLIFVAGNQPYLSQVDVTISDSSGTVLHVPDRDVTGPWLFIDLPEGTYTIFAKHGGQTKVKKGITVPSQGTKTIYFRWPRETAGYE